MKQVIIIAALVLGMMSCTEQQRARQWGGDSTINIPAGQMVVNATWKKADLWILTAPMDSAHIPTTLIFAESSSWSLMEGSITLKESK